MALETGSSNTVIVTEDSRMIISRGKCVIYGTIPNNKISIDFNDAVKDLISTYEHKCHGAFLLMNISTDQYSIVHNSLNSEGVFVEVHTIADYVSVDVADEPVFEFVVEQIRQSILYCRSNLFKFYLSAADISSHTLYPSDDGASAILKANNSGEIAAGSKILIKVVLYKSSSKEDTFIVTNGSFIEAN